MANQKQKEKKKKESERIAKDKVVARRKSLRATRKSEIEMQLRNNEAEIIMHGKLLPILNDPAAIAQRETSRAKLVSDKLKNNLAILEALEQEYEAEQAIRAEMNDKLEAEGHQTMREKMDALHKKALEITGKGELLAQAEKEYSENHKEIVV